MKYVFKMQILRLRFFLIPNAKKRSKLLKKKNIFYSMGENVHFQPRVIPADPKFIKIGNNVSIASNVTFVTHDIIHYVINNLPNSVLQNRRAESHLGCIEICDNVFIGSNVSIMPNVKINSNCIIGAGSIVTKDVPEGTIVAGCPAKVIGNFNDLVEKRLTESVSITTKNRLARIENEWKIFEEKKLHKR